MSADRLDRLPGGRPDALHPLAARMPDAVFRERTPRGGDRDRQFGDIREAVAAFLAVPAPEVAA